MTFPRYQQGDGLVRATVDTIAARLARLELDRAALLARFTPQSAEVMELNRQLQILREQLGQQPDAAAAELHADAVVLRAIEDRLAGLTVEHRLMLVSVRPEHETLRELARTVEELERRRAELKRPGAAPTGR